MCSPSPDVARVVVRYVVLVLAGLLSAPLMEFGSVLWMRAMPAGADLTANYFAMVVLPVALLLHFVMALALWKAFEPSPKIGGSLYLGSHIATQAAMLTLLGNPTGDILFYALTLLASGALILFVFDRYFWCPQCAGPI